ncbi:hypothetical protein V866_001716 [Kwoniella sp. B9012]
MGVCYSTIAVVTIHVVVQSAIAVVIELEYILGVQENKKVFEASLFTASFSITRKRSFFPPPVLYPAPIGPAPGPIIVQPAPIQPPLISYPSTVPRTFVQPVQVPTYPPQPQISQYTSPRQIPRYPSHSQQGSYIGPQAEHPAPRPSSRTDRRYSNEQYPQHHRDRRYSLEERVIAGHSPRIDPRRALTPEPHSHYRPKNHRSASTSRRIPEHQVTNEQLVLQLNDNNIISPIPLKKGYPIHLKNRSIIPHKII